MELKDSYETPRALFEGFEIINLGNYCGSNCFMEYGGCPTSFERVGVNIKEVTQEIKSYLERDSDVRIAFNAPNFLSIPNYRELLKILNSQKPKPYIRIENTVQGLNREDGGIYKMLMQGGIREVWMGVESGSDEVRNKYGKPFFSNEDLRNVHRNFDGCGINGCWYLVISQGDTEESIEETSSLVRMIQPHQVWISTGFKHLMGDIDLEEVDKNANRLKGYRKLLESIIKETPKTTIMNPQN